MDEKQYLYEINHALTQYNKGFWTIGEMESCIELATSAFLYKMKKNSTQ